MNFGGVVRMWQKGYGEELSYVKGMLDGPVRDMLIVMLEWHIGMKTDFIVNAGSLESISRNILKKICGCNLRGHFLMQNMKTYGNHSLSWVIYLGKWRTKLLTLMDIRTQGDDDRVTSYLKHVKALPKDSTSIY